MNKTEDAVTYKLTISHYKRWLSHLRFLIQNIAMRCVSEPFHRKHLGW